MTPPAAAARSTAPARRPVGPRRVSGPARRPLTSTAPLLPAPRHGVLRLVDHPLLDHLIRGRTWIGIVAFALIGIVAMQVALLKLNAGIGRSVERAAALQRANALLTGEVSTLRANGLRQAGATHQGMVYAQPGDVRYLTAGRGDAAQAAASVTPPRTAAAGPLAGSSGQGTTGSSSQGTTGSSGQGTTGSSAGLGVSTGVTASGQTSGGYAAGAAAGATDQGAVSGGTVAGSGG